MKTIDELIQEHKPLGERHDVAYGLIKLIAKEYASQFIDAAAKSAKTIRMGNSGSFYDAAVDIQSILKLKEQLV